jgi:hypothetical protein
MPRYALYFKLVPLAFSKVSSIEVNAAVGKEGFCYPFAVFDCAGTLRNI